jgi:transcriptional regulator of heat shock response
MLDRQERLLKKLIAEYIKTAEPVGSLKLATDLKVSSATVRNEMAELESAGYIYQPHTSAGRIPTEIGYAFYVERFVPAGKLAQATQKDLADILKQFSGEEAVKSLARLTAELADEAVVVAFNTNRFYYTGLSYLFAKPEFVLQAHVTSVSEVLDHCEEVMPRVFNLVNDGSRILIGQQNPFGKQCSFVAAPLFGDGIFGILGPMRMDYEKNLGFIEHIVKLIK